MPREYYVYPNGTSIAVAGNNEYATQIPMSASDATDVYTAISAKANTSDLATVATSGSYNDLSNKPTIPDISTKVSKSGDTMTGLLTLSGTQVQRAGGNTSWIKGRDVAPVKTTSGGSSWNPVVSAKSVNGAWGIGTLNDVLYFSYGTDTNYNNNTNTTNNYSIDSSGNLSNNINAQKFGNYTADLSTNNTSDTWVPVMSGGKMQHRVVPTDYNTAPTTDATANRIVKRDRSGYVKAVYYNASNGAENIASYTSYVMFKDSNGWQRMTSLANFKNWFGEANSATRVHNYNSGNLRFYAATSVITLKANSQQLVTLATLNSVFGVSNCGGSNTAVFACNGDGNAWGGRFTGCNLVGSGWNVMTHDTVPSAAVRVNWFAVYWG